jgi:hypothetical protein
MRFTRAALTLGALLAVAGVVWLLVQLIAPTANVLTGEPKIGVPYSVSVYTHCGLRHVEFDASNWAISGVLSDPSFNPPAGFGNPTDNGTVTLITRNTARYRSESGEERTLTRGGGLPWVEGCL